MAKKEGFLKRNWTLLLVLLYLIFPLDFIPDDIPIIGSFDDSFLLALGILRQYLDHRRGEGGVKES
jgi:uncharacterized membrane protein YkvA (DUF1232 family)